MYSYYLTRKKKKKNIIRIKVNTLTCKFSNPSVIIMSEYILYRATPKYIFVSPYTTLSKTEGSVGQ